MRVKLLREARIRHHIGEVVEVSPQEYQFLVTTGSAVPVVEEKKKAKKKDEE